MTIRDEFRLKKIWLNGLRSERFLVFQWRSPGILYVLYRLAVAAYTLTWLILTSHHEHKETKEHRAKLSGGVFLTTWTYVLLTIYFLLHALIAVTFYIACRGYTGLDLLRRLSPDQHKYLFHEIGNSYRGYEAIGAEETDEVSFAQSDRLPFYFVLLWIIFNAVSSAAIMVTIVFWSILVPGSGMDIANVDNIQLHLVNTILVLLEHSLTSVPVRLLHVVYPIVYGLVYMMFSLFYWVDDHSHVMYPILDWNKPLATVGYIVLVGFVILPLIHTAMYGLYRLRMFIYGKLSSDSL